MDVIKKDAVITNTDDTFPGSFQVILSAPTKDRDGETLMPDEWKQPLPDHITFDQDHAMTVAGTIGSGTPHLDPTGRLIVDGTYSSLPRAQEVRTLVNEGHIKTTSVAFMSEPAQTKDGKTRKVRELLNGAFVAIPSNREAVVLASKSISAKAGARNSQTDAAHIQAIHDHAIELGAEPNDPADMKSAKAAAQVPDYDEDPGKLAQACDAALDEAQKLIATVDSTTLPEPIQQALGLITAAEQAIDALLSVLGVPDPDDLKSANVNAEIDSNTSVIESKDAAAIAEELAGRGAALRAIHHYANAPERG